MNMNGWECKCGRVYAPWVRTCDTCGFITRRNNTQYYEVVTGECRHVKTEITSDEQREKGVRTFVCELCDLRWQESTTFNDAEMAWCVMGYGASGGKMTDQQRVQKLFDDLQIGYREVSNFKTGDVMNTLILTMHTKSYVANNVDVRFVFDDNGKLLDMMAVPRPE